MKAKEFVEKHYHPQIVISEKQTTNGGDKYYLLYSYSKEKGRRRIGCGDTLSKTYTDARENIAHQNEIHKL